MLRTLAFFLVLLPLKINKVNADAMVVGSVFCDRCKDGELSLLDYPMNGVKVKVMCVDNNGQMTMSEDATSNWVGGYSMWVRGDVDLSGCYAHVAPVDPTTDLCTAAAGPAQPLTLMWSLFNGGMYRVDALLTEPANPMSYCPRSDYNPTRSFACTWRDWTVTERRCYWSVVGPESKVAWVFGVLAAEKYGLEMTLWEGLHQRGEPLKALLREATTALLNSYSSDKFSMSSVSVISHMNLALMGSRIDVLRSASRFMRANSGSCNFSPCRS